MQNALPAGYQRRRVLVASDVDGPGVQLRVNPDIARALREEESAVLREMQTAVGRKVSIRSDPHLHHEQFDVMVL